MGNFRKKKWFVILNPHAGSGRGKKDQAVIINLLNKSNFLYELAISEFPKHTIQLTIQAVENGYRNFIVAGGDGTLNEVVNGIFTQTICPTEEITIGMIPVGTGNDWIKTFGIPNDYQAAINIILQGDTMRQNVGLITFPESDLMRTYYFANMAGFGFDARVAEKSNQLKDKGRKGISVYLQALGSSFWNYQTTKTCIVIDGQEINELIFSVSIGIGKYNGGGMMQAPGAIPNNGQFQVTVIRKIGIFGILRNLAGLYSGEFIKDFRVSTHKASHILISSAQNIAGEADGEILGHHKFEIELIFQKLEVIYNPEKYLKFG
ncbi:MAG: diacylglycerol kinase family lipid kinase [Bacteroidota bacterium]|nr:lipid kinase [Odoribacter sp.]MDP3643449.1 diacylglycerol kinase family lipid kinase [Bacteroidota bacterium]